MLFIISLLHAFISLLSSLHSIWCLRFTRYGLFIIFSLLNSWFNVCAHSRSVHFVLFFIPLFQMYLLCADHFIAEVIMAEKRYQWIMYICFPIISILLNIWSTVVCSFEFYSFLLLLFRCCNYNHSVSYFIAEEVLTRGLTLRISTHSPPRIFGSYRYYDRRGGVPWWK